MQAASRAGDLLGASTPLQCCCLPLVGWRTDPSQSYSPPRDLFRAPTVSCAVLVIILAAFVVICLIIHNLYLFDFSLSFFFIYGIIF